MQVEDGVTIEADLSSLLDQEFDRLLVVQNHLRLQGLLAFGLLALGEEALGVEQRIGIALQTAGIPGQVNQQTAEDLPRIGTSGTWTIRRASPFEQTLPSFRGKVKGHVGPIHLKEGAVVS